MSKNEQYKFDYDCGKRYNFNRIYTKNHIL